MACGSSPLARGLRVRVFEWCAGVGIIPARAGFTETTLYMPVWLEDHPRSRGVYWGCWGWLVLVWGSSPLARGLRRVNLGLERLDRIIPARAGFTHGGAFPGGR